MTNRIKNIIIMFAALIVGFFIYVMFRPETYISLFISEYFPVNKIQGKFSGMNFGYYFPDFLWGLALGCGLVSILQPGKKGVILCGIISFLSGFVWEVGQLAGVFGGTADPIDILLYLLASVVCILLNAKETKNEET